MPAQRKYPKYPEELRERAVRMVFEIRDRDGKGWAKAAAGAETGSRAPGPSGSRST